MTGYENRQSMAGTLSPQDCETKREGEIPCAVGRLEKAVVAVREAADFLGARIGAVLSPNAPIAGNGQGDKPQPARCDLAAVLHDRSSNLENIASLLHSLAHRVEL